MATLNTPRSQSSFKLKKPVRRTSIPSTIESTDEKHECVTLIWFDPQGQSNGNLTGAFRAIHDSVQVFTEFAACLDVIKGAEEKIFFISSSNNSELIGMVNALTAVEAIFILTNNAESVKGDLPKIFGVFNQQEELLRVLKEILDIFEQVQSEEFHFEEEKVFLWAQLWKEELISRKPTSNKQPFLDMVRYYYGDNPRILDSIAEFEKSYRPAEAIHWCYRLPFPSRFLLHALRFHSKRQLNVCRFLFTDASRSLQQQPKRKTGDQVYRGMKLSSALLDQFEGHVGQLFCTHGFFPCTKSRTNALTLASLPAYRPDLLPVLFKIDCDASSLYTELPQKQSTPVVVFDTCVAFRVVYVHRGQMSIVKMKTAGEAGKKIAVEYLEKHKDETIQSMMDELLTPPKPPTPPPPPRLPTPPPPREPTPPPPPEPVIIPTEPTINPDEIKAKKYAEKGDVDLAIVTYRRIQPMTARILNIIGQLCADRKGDYEFALQCFKQALKMQEKSGEDISETLTHLGNVYHRREEYDFALYYHQKALELREAFPTTNSMEIASSLLGIGHAHRARNEYSEAIANTERALALQKAVIPSDENSIAKTLVLLGNIYQDFGDHAHALDLYQQASIIFEQLQRADSPTLAEFFYNLGLVQVRCEALADAEMSLERSVKIYRRLWARGHPDRVLAENEYRRVLELQQKNKDNSAQQ